MSDFSLSTRYGTVAVTLHWLIAAALIANIGLGLYMSEVLSDQDPLHSTILQFHKPLGLTVLALSVVRVVWRLINRPPPLPTSIPSGERVLAHTTHFLLYFLIIVIPLTGWAMVSSSRNPAPISYFGIFQWPRLSDLAEIPRTQRIPLHHDLGTAHLVLALSAMVLVPIHVAAAFYHRRRGVDVLSRMLPWSRVFNRTH